ncbi:triacylglycerol lipase [Ancylostoma duodenale]|uniref:Triacylglycerol lipase n=1 Tax=Ancylostoma duodenale TaxID=51022 RepID=A0A0C2DHP7_9BILA|nr:triacylglycerol lipase [Ancylostoma duodenale]
MSTSFYIRTFTTDCDSSGNQCRGLLAVSVEAKSIYVAYRDSESQKQFAAEMLNGFGAQLGAWEKFDNSEAGVISYFHHAFYRTFLGTGMKEHFLELKKKYANYRVWVTGYSLGGSLASLTALYLAKNDLVDKKVVASIPRSADPSTTLTGTLYQKQPLFYRYLVHYNNKMEKGDSFRVSLRISIEHHSVVV